MSVDRRAAAAVVQEALAAVLDPALVPTLREDTPLAAAGMTSADAVCVADAVAAAGLARGIDGYLGDADFATAVTVGDLVEAVRRNAGGADAD